MMQPWGLMILRTKSMFQNINSKSGLWSTRDSGLVSGVVGSTFAYHRALVFYYASRNFVPSFPFRGKPVAWDFLQDRYVVAERVDSEPYALQVSEHKLAEQHPGVGKSVDSKNLVA